MKTHQGFQGLLAALAVAVLALSGCGQARDNAAKKEKGGEVAKGKHEGWWCDEHGVPEEECSMCSDKAAKAFKEKGDWCKEHERAKSQCFICDPSLKDKYAVQYKAKYGKEPPAPTDNMKK